MTGPRISFPPQDPALIRRLIELGYRVRETPSTPRPGARS